MKIVISKIFLVIIFSIISFSVSLQHSFADLEEERQTEAIMIEQIYQGLKDGKPVIEKRQVPAQFGTLPQPYVQGCEEVEGVISAELAIQTTSKILPDLQKQINEEKEILCIDVVLPYYGIWTNIDREPVPGWEDVRLQHVKTGMNLAQESIQETINKHSASASESRKEISKLEGILNDTIHYIAKYENLQKGSDKYLPFVEHGHEIKEYTESKLDFEKKSLSDSERLANKFENYSDLQIFSSRIESGIGIDYVDKQKQAYVGKYAIQNLKNIKEFLENNNAVLEADRNENLKVHNSRNIHFGAAVASSLIPELVLRDDVIALDAYGKKIVSTKINPVNKIGYILWGVLNTGMYVNPCSENHYNIVDFQKGTIPVSVRYHASEPIQEFLSRNSFEITSQSDNRVIANVPVSSIMKLAKMDSVTSLEVFVDCMRVTVFTQEDKERMIVGYDGPLVSNPDNVSFDLTSDDIMRLDILGDITNSQSLEIPKNISGKPFDMLLNGIAIIDGEIQELEIFVNDVPLTQYTATSRGHQTILVIASPLHEKDFDATLDAHILRESVSFSKQNMSEQLTGMKSKNIQCKESHVLVVRDNGKSACISEENAEKIADRFGWKIAELAYQK